MSLDNSLVDPILTFHKEECIRKRNMYWKKKIIYLPLTNWNVRTYLAAKTFYLLNMEILSINS